MFRKLEMLEFWQLSNMLTATRICFSGRNMKFKKKANLKVTSKDSTTNLFLPLNCPLFDVWLATAFNAFFRCIPLRISRSVFMIPIRFILNY